jgi:hypothetical protein
MHSRLTSVCDCVALTLLVFSGTVKSVSEMAALGFHLPSTTFADRMTCAPHLLAPTGQSPIYNENGVELMQLITINPPHV